MLERWERRRIRAICAGFCCAALLGCEPAAGPASTAAPTSPAPVTAPPLDEFAVYQAPSAPLPIDRVLAEWEPAAALLLALPQSDAIENARLFAYFMDLAENAIRVVDVVLLLDERELLAQEAVLEELERRGLARFLGDDAERRITLLPVRMDSKWLRDYGPMFALDPQGGAVLLDTIYDDLRSGWPSGRSVLDFDLDAYARGALAGFLEQAPPAELPPASPQDDSIAIYIADYLGRQDRVAAIDRAPLLLPGGDLFTDGRGRFFTSWETLLLNGARRGRVEEILTTYYGMKGVTYLEALPGDTVKHLDMIFRPLDEGRLLLAEYPPEVPTADAYMRYLHAEARRVLERDASVLRRAFPDRELIRVPMPPLSRLSRIPELAVERTLDWFENRDVPAPRVLLESPESWDLDRFAQFTHALQALEDDAPSARDLGEILDLDEDAADERLGEAARRLVERLVRDDAALGRWMVASLGTEAGAGGPGGDAVGRARARIVADQLDPAIHDDPNGFAYVYRSYLNATQLEGPGGRMLLVPRYSGYAEYESRVEALYRELYPGAEIVFVDSDAVIEQYGAIHCTTLVVPDLARR